MMQLEDRMDAVKKSVDEDVDDANAEARVSNDPVA